MTPIAKTGAVGVYAKSLAVSHLAANACAARNGVRAGLACTMGTIRPRMAVETVKPMQMYLAISLGSAIGGALRYFLSGLAAGQFGETFPWGTLLVNVTGSFIIGFFGTLTAPDGRVFVSGTTRQFVMTGICGGYTTFSSFSLQTLALARDEEWLYAGGNVVASVALCLIAVWLGHITAAAINQLKGA